MACFSQGSAEEVARPTQLIVHRPSAVAVYFTWRVDGDADRDARVTVEYRKRGEAQWQKSAFGGRTGEQGALQGCIAGLEPQTEYECRFTMSDPDGIVGEAVRTATVKVPALHQFNPSWPQGYSPDPAKRDPALRIADGDTVLTEMVPGNALRGFFCIEGAEPGDALAIRLERLEPHATGDCAAQLSPITLEPSARDPGLKYGHGRWTVDPKTGMATLTQVVELGADKTWTEVQSRLKGLHLPVRPMVGTMATALDVEVGKAPSVMTSGRHGGNIDWNGAAEGVTMYFPVFAKGGLFGLGDCHARQGDGEINNEAIEIGMKVRFTAWVVKGWKINGPRGEDADSIFTIGCAPPPFDQAVQAATTEMYRWLQADYGLDQRSAAILMGMCLKYEVGNVVDPAWTMVCKMPKSVLRRFGTSPYDRQGQEIRAAEKP